MAELKSQLEALINFPADGDGKERRDILRAITDQMLTAPDRMQGRQLEYFDILFSRNAIEMERSLRRAMAMALVKSDFKLDTVKQLLGGEHSRLSQILRRSVLFTVPDLVMMIRERSTAQFQAPLKPVKTDGIYAEMNRYTLPPVLALEIYRFIYFSLKSHLSEALNEDHSALLDRTAARFRERIIIDAQTLVRDEIIAAAKQVRERIRVNGVNEAYLKELFQSDNSTEVILALAELVNVDPNTMIRILNDNRWECFAIACRGARVPRGFFADIVAGMQRRQNDEQNSLRIIGLYNTLPQDSAERVMRFWQVRANALKDVPLDEAPELDRKTA